MKYPIKSIKEIPPDLRPREKLIKHGPGHLSDAELLAVILKTGTREADVLSLSKALIDIGWKKLEQMSIEELMEIKGLGFAKASEIKALIELSKRIREPFNGRRILGPGDAYEFLKDKFDQRKETLVAMFLDTSNRILDFEVVAVGSLNRVYAEPRDVLRRAVELSCYGIIVAHNHPGGNSEPSDEDLSFTKRLSEACRLMGFSLLDHIIIGDEYYTSLRSSGFIG